VRAPPLTTCSIKERRGLSFLPYPTRIPDRGDKISAGGRGDRADKSRVTISGRDSDYRGATGIFLRERDIDRSGQIFVRRPISLNECAIRSLVPLPRPCQPKPGATDQRDDTHRETHF
jgi:hypothetical protein